MHKKILKQFNTILSQEIDNIILDSKKNKYSPKYIQIIPYLLFIGSIMYCFNLILSYISYDIEILKQIVKFILLITIFIFIFLLLRNIYYVERFIPYLFNFIKYIKYGALAGIGVLFLFVSFIDKFISLYGKQTDKFISLYGKQIELYLTFTYGLMGIFLLLLCISFLRLYYIYKSKGTKK